VPQLASFSAIPWGIHMFGIIVPCFLAATVTTFVSRASGGETTQAARGIAVSSLMPTESQQGYGSLGIDRSVMGKPLQIGGRRFQSGLGTHASSRIVYDLEGPCERFEAWVGVDAEMRGYKESSVVFKVLTDGRVAFESDVMRIDTPAKRVTVPLTGVRELQLVVTDAGDGVNCDHADWAEAVIFGQPELPAAASGPKRFEVATHGIAVELSAEGQIVGVILGDKKLQRGLRGSTSLAHCSAQGKAMCKRLGGGGLEFSRTLTCPAQRQSCQVVERFQPTGASIRWEVEIRGDAGPWTTNISTVLQYPATDESRFWTAWSDPDNRSDGWRDPLVLMPFRSATWNYTSLSNGCPVEGDYICMPLATVLEPAADSGLSLAVAPQDSLLDLRLSTTAAGGVRFMHSRHRIAKGTSVHLAMDLVPHAADCRGGLGWMVQRHPEYFNPPNPKADAMAGCGAYSADERQFDTATLRRMAFRINWKCSEDFAYMGMFLPPMPDDSAAWQRGSDEPPIPGKSAFNSYKSLNDYSRWMRGQGFYVLNYFNVTEFGRNMRWPAPPRSVAREADMWKDPNDFLYAKLRESLLLENGRPIGTCYNAFILDVGEPCYQQFILEQARRQIDKLPDSSGICIDRLDWLRYYNDRGDDGMSWVDGKPARSLYQSWHGLLEKLGPMMHRAGKVIFVNNHLKRLELLRHVDGIYCEFCQTGPALNSTGLLTLRKPAVGWTVNPDTLRPDPDAFFQRHLHMGVYPTAPYPGNNHCIQPDAWAQKQYLDYGPLLSAIRGKKWVLVPHVVRVSGVAKANLFEVPGGYAMPVTFAGKAKTVEVTLKRLSGMSETIACQAIHPGSAKVVIIKPKMSNDSIRLEVPVVRGCAMVELR
jgi:hypothetical protein